MIKIYLLTNQINKKVYVGKTKQEYKKRMNNGNGYRECPAVYADIQKYGAANFVYTTLTTVATNKEAKVLETIYMDQYDSRNPEVGYNINAGGAGSDGILSQEGREKLQRTQSKETIAKREASRMEPQEIQDQICAAYLAHKTIDEIKKEFSIGGNGKIYRILDKNGIKRLNNFSKWKDKTHSEDTKSLMSQRRKEYWGARKA